MLMLYDDRTGEWSRDSAFGDIGALLLNIKSMDPAWQAGPHEKVAIDRGVGAAKVSGSLPSELPGQALFAKACASCHTIGSGDRVGPDLKSVLERRERDWLKQYIRSPSEMRAKNDETALALAAAYPRVRMPNLQLSDTDVTDVLSYLNARQFALGRGADDSAKDGHGAHHHHHHKTSGDGTKHKRHHH
jgi:cytochrome c2